MTSWLLGVTAVVLAGLVLAVLGWMFAPTRNRLERKRMTVTGDHGIALTTYGSPDQMQGLDPNQMLGLQPFWLTDSDYYFVDGVPGQGPSSKAEWLEWAQARGGEGAGWRHILLRIQATQDRTVLLLLPKVNVKRTSAVGGVILGPEKQPGGNGLMCRQFEIRLDANPPVARYLPEGSFDPPQFIMKKGDSEAFLLIARAERGRYEWSVDVECLVDGEAVSLRADDFGKPLVTVGFGEIERLWWMFDEHRWMPAAW